MDAWELLHSARRQLGNIGWIDTIDGNVRRPSTLLIRYATERNTLADWARQQHVTFTEKTRYSAQLTLTGSGDTLDVITIAIPAPAVAVAVATVLLTAENPADAATLTGPLLDALMDGPFGSDPPVRSGEHELLTTLLIDAGIDAYGTPETVADCRTLAEYAARHIDLVAVARAETALETADADRTRTPSR